MGWLCDHKTLYTRRQGRLVLVMKVNRNLKQLKDHSCTLFETSWRQIVRSNHPAERKRLCIPSFHVGGPLLKFLESSVVSFTIIVPQLDSLPFWRLHFCSRAASWIQLGSKGNFDELLYPSSDNLSIPSPLQWNLFAFKLKVHLTQNFFLLK